MPRKPVEYQHLLTGPRARAWKPPVALLLALSAWAAGMVFTALSLVVYGLATGAPLSQQAAGDLDLADPFVFGVGNVVIAALIPTATLSIWAVHRVRPGYVSSVVGRLRWRWLLRCAALLVPIWVPYVLLSTWLGGGTLTLQPEPKWALLLPIVLLTTPLQSAGEEYLFRGWVMQNLGVWIRRPGAALVVSALVSAVLFALAHGSADPWILLDLCVFAAAAVLLTWRTGGLEAAVAMHAVNNVVGLLFTIGAGGFADAFITGTSSGSPWQVLQSAVVEGLAVVLLLSQARRRGIDRRYRPAADPLPPTDAALPAPGLPGMPGFSPRGT